MAKVAKESYALKRFTRTVLIRGALKLRAREKSRRKKIGRRGELNRLPPMLVTCSAVVLCYISLFPASSLLWSWCLGKRWAFSSH